METIAKPDELLALHDVTDELFTMLKEWFEVPDRAAISLGDIDSAVTELGDPVMIAALAMRKLQALRLLAQPGVRTSTDVVVAIVQDLDRALLQAPTMRLRREAEQTDWDAAFADLVAETDDGGGGSADPGDDPAAAAEPVVDDLDLEPGEDPEEQRFRTLHGALHRALRAVIEASDGEIRYLV